MIEDTMSESEMRKRAEAAHGRLVEALKTVQDERDRLHRALEIIRDELGVPRPGYPAPVSNACQVVKAALAGEDLPAAWDRHGQPMAWESPPEDTQTSELEQLCVDFIRRLERGDEYDAQVEMLRTWVCDRHPDVAGGGE